MVVVAVVKEVGWWFVSCHLHSIWCDLMFVESFPFQAKWQDLLNTMIAVITISISGTKHKHLQHHHWQMMIMMMMMLQHKDAAGIPFRASTAIDDQSQLKSVSFAGSLFSSIFWHRKQLLFRSWLIFYKIIKKTENGKSEKSEKRKSLVENSANVSNWQHNLFAKLLQIFHQPKIISHRFC